MVGGSLGGRTLATGVSIPVEEEQGPHCFVYFVVHFIIIFNNDN